MGLLFTCSVGLLFTPPPHSKRELGPSRGSHRCTPATLSGPHKMASLSPTSRGGGPAPPFLYPTWGPPARGRKEGRRGRERKQRRGGQKRPMGEEQGLPFAPIGRDGSPAAAPSPETCPSNPRGAPALTNRWLFSGWRLANPAWKGRLISSEWLLLPAQTICHDHVVRSRGGEGGGTEAQG